MKQEQPTRYYNKRSRRMIKINQNVIKSTEKH